MIAVGTRTPDFGCVSDPDLVAVEGIEDRIDMVLRSGLYR
jgi:hypothetical protein